MGKLKYEIKPCPYCGCPNRLIIYHILTRKLPWWYYVGCDNCHWFGSAKLGMRRAVKSWNWICDAYGEFRKEFKECELTETKSERGKQ